MAIVKIDSNFTGASIAEESALGVLPGSPVWQDMEPNEYSDFGAELSTVARAPIAPDRQNKKGAVVDLDAAGGFSLDFTKSNMTKFLQGFFFADAKEQASTKPLNAAAVVITGANSTDKSYNAASGLAVFKAGDLIHVSGFNQAANNGLKTVVTAVAGKITVAETLVTEAGTAAVVISRAGVQFASGDAVLDKTGDVVSLTLTAGSFSANDGFIAGAWVHIGGDATITRFTGYTGFARIGSVSAKTVVFDQLSGVVAASDTGTAKTIQVYQGTVVRNEKNPSLIKRRTYQIERSLGTSDVGAQAEYLEGAIPNEFTLNASTADKVTCDISYVATGYSTRSGAIGNEKKAGTHLVAPGEAAYNTSSNVPSVAIVTYDATKSKQKPLFAYAEGFTFAINNNVSPNKAIGVLGAFEASIGQFDVTVSTDAYFADVAALTAIRGNADVGAYMILAQNNYGLVFDLPLATIGGGSLNVAGGESIKTSLELTGAENRFGYTAQYQTFAYLPTVAMPAV